MQGTINSIEKGSYGQWHITALIGGETGYFKTVQYYFCLRREAKAQAEQALREGNF